MAMFLQRFSVLLCALGLIAIAGACGDDDGLPPPPPPPDAGYSCIDTDGDGYGIGCLTGDDCDDTNADITSQCRSCLDDAVRENCPCEPQMGLLCVPPRIRVAEGILVCREGTRYCRDGFWTACEPEGEGYVLIPN